MSWRGMSWPQVLAGGAALFGVGCAGVAWAVHTTTAAQGRQLNHVEKGLDQLRVDLPAGLNGVAEQLELSDEVHGRQLDRLEKRLERSEEVHGRQLDRLAERLEESIAAGHDELLRNADKDRSDLLQAVDRMSEVRVPSRGVLGSCSA